MYSYNVIADNNDNVCILYNVLYNKIDKNVFIYLTKNQIHKQIN